MAESLYISIGGSLLLNGMVMLSGWLAATRLAGRGRGVDRLPAAFAVSMSLIVIIYEILSVLNSMDFRSTVAMHAAALLAIWLVYRRTRGRRVRVAGVPETSVYGRPLEKKSLPRSIILYIFIFYFLVSASFALIMPPSPADAFLDHLVFPAEWLRAGRITLVQTLSPEQATTYYPSNGELVYLWLIMPLKNDLLSGLFEAMCLLVCMATSFRIAKRAGLGDGNAIAGAAAGAAAPLVLRQVQQFGVDLFFAASFLTAAAYLLPDSEGRRAKGELVVAGLAAGLAVGSKYIGAVFIALLFPLVFAAKKDKSKVASAAMFIVAAAASGAFWYVRNLALTGSPFYPLGMSVFGVKIFSGAFERGAMLASHMHVPVSDIVSLKSVFSNYVAGPWLIGGIPFILIAAMGGAAARGEQPWRSAKSGALVLMLAAVAGTAAVSFWRIGSAAAIVAFCFVIPAAAMFAFSSGRSWGVRYLFVLAPAAMFVFWCVNPYNIANNARFAIPGVVLFFVFAAYAIEESGWNALWLAAAPGLLIGNYDTARRFGRFVADMFSGGSLAMEGAPTAVAALLAVMFGSYFLGLLVGRRPRQALKLIPLLAIAALVVISLKADFMKKHRYEWYEGHYLAAGWNAMERITEGKAATIAYAGNCAPYGLYGDRLKNRVLYVNIDGSRDRVFHSYERGRRTEKGYAPPADSTDLNGIFRAEGDYEAWRGRLASEKADYLFVSIDYHPKRGAAQPIEMKWALSHPDDFQLVFRSGDNLIFKIKRRGR